MNAPKRVLVLGATGMLGSMLADELGRDARLAVTATARGGRVPLAFPNTTIVPFDAESDHDLDRFVSGQDLVVNALGATRARTTDSSAGRAAAAFINAVFPHRLAACATRCGAKLVHFSTNGVFRPERGGCRESDVPDALDFYGRSKALGEPREGGCTVLRCSIIGLELGTRFGLLAWLLSQGRDATVPGFVDQSWNGLTTLDVAAICRGLACSEAPPPGVIHLSSSDVVSKADLLLLCARAFGRSDLTIDRRPSGHACDQTLATERQDEVAALWRQAGAADAPSVHASIEALAERSRRSATLNGSG